MLESDHSANSGTADRPSLAPRADATARRKCFVVDDEPGVRTTLSAVLGWRGPPPPRGLPPPYIYLSGRIRNLR
jgi:hypothetical protein